MNELRNRGVGDILIAVVDGLKGFRTGIVAGASSLFRPRASSLLSSRPSASAKSQRLRQFRPGLGIVRRPSGNPAAAELLRPIRSSKKIAESPSFFLCAHLCARISRCNASHVRAPHIFLARPVQSAELVKCVRAIMHKELGHCLAADIASRAWDEQAKSGAPSQLRGNHLSGDFSGDAAPGFSASSKTGASVSGAAKALGFSEISAFTRAFRRWSGETPSSWKLRHQRSRAEHPRDARAPWRSTEDREQAGHGAVDRKLI